MASIINDLPGGDISLSASRGHRELKPHEVAERGLDPTCVHRELTGKDTFTIDHDYVDEETFGLAVDSFVGWQDELDEHRD